MTLVLLDRDGVINFDRDDYIRSPAEWEPIPGSIEAIALLKRANFDVAICTNQSGIARGFYTEKGLEQIHAKMHSLIAEYSVKLDGLYFCPHSPEAKCKCRKPEVGLLERALSDLSGNVGSTWFIGDSLRDIQAALKLACEPILVRTGNGATHETSVRALGVNNIHDSLASASQWLIETICPDLPR